MRHSELHNFDGHMKEREASFAVSFARSPFVCRNRRVQSISVTISRVVGTIATFLNSYDQFMIPELYGPFHVFLGKFAEFSHV